MEERHFTILFVKIFKNNVKFLLNFDRKINQEKMKIVTKLFSSIKWCRVYTIHALSSELYNYALNKEIGTAVDMIGKK